MVVLPLPAVPVAEQVFSALHRAIVHLDLLPGQAVSENTIAGQMQVSRTPVREGLQRLQRQGLVTVLPQRGSFVTALDGAAIRAAYFIRLSLEKAVAGEAARRRDDGHVAGLRRVIRDQREALDGGDADTFFALNAAFHAGLTEAADLVGVGPALAMASDQLNRVRFAHLRFGSPYKLDAIVAEHERIVAAVARGDAAAAEAEMHRHIEKALPRFDELRALKPEFFEPPGHLRPVQRPA